MSTSKESDIVFNENFNEQETKLPISSTQPDNTTVTSSLLQDHVVPAVTDAIINEVKLNFTESTTSPYVAGNITTGEGSNLPPSYQPPVGNEGSGGTGGGGKTAKLGWISLKYFQKYFDVDTNDVLERLFLGLKGPFDNTFLEKTREKPDLYGPFWIAATLMFLTAVSSNFAAYIDHLRDNSDEEIEWISDYNRIFEAFLIFFIYIFIGGLLLYLFLLFSKSDMSLALVWCIYGYSMATFLPVALGINFLQLLGKDTGNLLTYIIVFCVTVYSGIFLMRNFKNELYEREPKKALAILSIIVIFHLVIGSVLAFYFY